MRDAREYIQPNDLVGVCTGRTARIVPGIARKFTDKSFQYTSLQPYRVRRAQREDYSLNKVESEIKGNKYLMNPSYPDYIQSRLSERVMLIGDNQLDKYENLYYEILKEELNL